MKMENSGKRDQERDAILRLVPAGMIRLDARDLCSILWYNDIFLEMIEYTREQFEEELHSQCTYLHPEDFKRASVLAGNLTESGEHVVFEVRAYTRSKAERIWTISLCYVSGEDCGDGIPSYYSIGLDITGERKKIEPLQHIAEKDSLTGIYNRAETEKQIKRYIVENSNAMGALFMIDTDNFKQINDTNGHMVGDIVLAEMAAGMKGLMRESDIVGRIGGDEFIIFMKNIVTPKDAEKKAEDLLRMFRHLFEKEKSPVCITCSIGAAIYPRDGRTFKEMYRKADLALYQAKSQGKNHYVIYDCNKAYELGMMEYSSPKTAIESENRYAKSGDNLARYVFRILYQAENVDQAVNAVLEVVGKQFDVSRAYVFENTSDGKYTTNTYEWCSKGIEPEIDNLKNLEFKDYGDYEKLFGEDSIFYCRDIHTLKPEQEELLARQKIHSTLQCAYWDEKVFSGFVGFDECTGLRLWTQEEVSTLSLISQVLSIFLQSKKVKKVNQEMQQYQTVLNSLDECIYVVEKEEGVLLYGNRKFRELYPECKLGHSWSSGGPSFENLNKMSIVWEQKAAFLCIE
ncbi:diguanylate cyclase [Muricomes sp. OA1]|uniref:Diguanylate cyclase n=2 Tax=Lachnospiraceae TaxID=186803 RepID=A0A3E2WJJ4_9FIRM|nr:MULTISPECIES: diguanylate cyclase [Clostridia]MCH1972854.1 diguanylate cyclase [Muricomes sp. OA1]RGC26660.1 diguanylate cyclase [Hungatella hathewayi]GKH31624.1 hypothetical protein CE91St64_10310 [Faecalicatena contorta]